MTTAQTPPPRTQTQQPGRERDMHPKPHDEAAGYVGSGKLAGKVALVAFTRSLSIELAERDIRVNAVAPGPIWTPLIPSTFSAEQVSTFGSNVPLKRSGQPDELIGG